MSTPSVVTDQHALEGMASKIDHLPMLPQVLARIVQLDAEADDYFDEFSLLAREDPTLTVRIVALANSAASAPAHPIVSIKDALVRTGTEGVRSLVMSLAVQRVFIPTNPGQISLWQHSVTTAVAAEFLARLAKGLKVDPDYAYLVGLLHDIGRFVMFEHAPDDLAQVDSHDWHNPEQLIEADFDVFSFTHSELGYRACQHWGLPRCIAECVRSHHSAPLPEVRPATPQAVSYCLQVADRLALTVLGGGVDRPETREELLQVIEADCLTPVHERAFVSAADIASRLPAIDEARSKLLAGLGYA